MPIVQRAYTVRPLRSFPVIDTVERVRTVPEGAEPAATHRPSPAGRP